MMPLTNDFEEEEIEQPQISQQNKSNDFEEEEILDDYLNDESFSERVLEQPIASFLAHGIGTIAALPGNVRDLVYATGEEAKGLRQYISDKFGLKYDDEFLKNDSIKNFDESIKAPFNFISGYIPNSEDVNNYIDNIAGGYFAPKSDTQKLANNMAEDIVASVLNRSPKSFLRNFVIPVGANSVKKGAELFGVDPSTQEALKMISWIGADMAVLSDPRTMLSNRINQTRRLIPARDMIPVTARDLRYLDQLENMMTSGGSRPSTSAALTKIQEMRQAMQGGQVSARQMLDFYRAKNELFSNFGAFSVEGPAKAEHVFRLRQVQNGTNSILNRYGRNQNPRFLESFRETNLGWSALHQSNNVAAFVKKNYTRPFVSEAAKGIFMNATGKGLAVAAGLTGLERLQSFIRRLENPILRQYYGDVLRHSLTDNRAAMINSLHKFDNAAKKMEDKEKD